MNPSSAPHPAPPEPASPPIAQLERKALALLMLVAAVILGFLLYVMYARGVFEHTQKLVLISDDSEGVIVGMDLTFSGFPIGRVQRIELAPDGKARMVIEVPQKDAHWLRTSSIFTMERGMVGETRIRAFSGILSDPVLPANAERTLLRGDASAEIPRLIATTRTLLENLEGMTSADSSLNSSLAHLKLVTERLTGRYGMLTGALGTEDHAKKVIATLDNTNNLLSKADQRVFGAKGLMDNTQATLASTQAAMAKLTSDLSGVLQDARHTLSKVDAVLVEAQGVGANARVASADLGTLRAEVEASLRRLNQLTDDINRKWPFARDTEIKLP
jgi:phospholipid/cholesterol/gamma-HCH transport system substrate-binding protein